MKVLRGIEKIGNYSNIPVSIDWDYLVKDFGFRKELQQFDYALGYLLKLIGGLIVFVGFVIGSKDATTPFIEKILFLDNSTGLGLWLGLALIIYSLFLSRNRNVFADNLEIATLIELAAQIKDKKKITEIELEDYLSYELLELLDDAVKDNPHNFLGFLLSQVMNKPEIALLVSRLGLNPGQFDAVEQRLSLEQNTHVDEWYKDLLLGAFNVAVATNNYRVDEVALFLYLAAGPLNSILNSLEVHDHDVEALQIWVRNNNLKNIYLQNFAEKSGLKPLSPLNRSMTSKFSPTLEQFSRDLTVEVAKGDFLLSIGREVEMEKLVELVQEGDSSATLVIGSPGVGKSTFIKSLAVKMVVEDVPDPLKDMRLVSFEFNRAFALSKNVDDFKAKVEMVLEEVSAAGNIILLLEDFDQMINVRSEFSSEIISLVIKALDSYKMRIIATTNPEGYTRHIEAREELARLFSVLKMAEPKDPVAVQILLDEMPALEKKYALKIEFNALPKAVELSHQYEFERVLPDKALELLEETCSRAQMQNLIFVDNHQVEEVVSAKVGVNVGKISGKESQLLLHLEDKIHNRIVGQEQAVVAVAAALRRARAGLTKKNRPIASFLFFGPTGVGKTELAKALAASYYGDEKLMIRLDMSEYQEAENLKRLIGEAKEDQFTGGYLTEAVRNKPYSLILLDEVEKANIKVLDLFLQVLDEGNLTDGAGRKVSFNNTIIIMTSNACSGQIAELVSAGRRYIDIYRLLQPELRKVFRIEFLNRFDKVIMFKPLLPVEMLQVVNLMLVRVHDLLVEKGIELTWDQSVLSEIIETGYDPVYGARELRRVIQDYVEDKIAQLIIDNKIKSGSLIKIHNLSEFEIA